MMEMFDTINAQVVESTKSKEAFLDLYAQGADSKYRMDLFNTFKTFDLTEREAATCALEVTLSVNYYDEEISHAFINKMLIPTVDGILKYQSHLPIHKNLSTSELLRLIAKGLSLTYNL